MNSRLWDGFLTDRDKAVRDILGNRPGVVLGSRPALLMIDQWQAMLGDRSEPMLDGIQRNRFFMGTEAWSAVECSARVLHAFRREGHLVVYTTGTVDPSQPRGWIASNRELPPDTNPDRFRLVESVQPVDGEYVLTKSAASAFWGTGLLGLLVENRIDSLVVCGESTSGCVRATVVDGASYRYKVAVLADCVYDRFEASHAVALFDMDDRYARVMDSDDAVSYASAVGHAD